MKTTLIKIKKLVFLLIVCLSPILLSAQDDVNKKKPNAENREAAKIAFFTSKMQLTPEESEKFWPIVNEMEAELKALRTEMKDESKKKTDKSEITDKELEERMDDRMEMGKKQMDIKINYHEKFKEVLPIKKVAKYYEATREFKKVKAKRKADQMKKHMDGPPHGKPSSDR